MESTGLKRMNWYQWLIFLLPFLVPAGIALGLFIESFRIHEAGVHRSFRDVAHWFDPVFFQYTLILWLLAILVVPSFAVSYLKVMTAKKERRLLREVPEEYHDEIKRRMGQRSSFGSYWGSVLCTTFVVLMGTSTLLLLKPVFSAIVPGVNFEQGANILLVGSFAELLTQNPDAFYSYLIRNLTAFQFGFLGAYIYFIGALARAYFTQDLTAHTFVDGTIRMIVASILALVVVFSFGSFDFEAIEITTETVPFAQGLIPIVSFFLGFYPKHALATIEQIARKVIKKSDSGYRSFPLTALSGMSDDHELRLNREGFDNVENLSNADAVDLSVRTCFSYRQLRQWCGEAWLVTHLREDYAYFVRCTGITSKNELQDFMANYDQSTSEAAVALLVAALVPGDLTEQQWKTKLATLKVLLANHSIAA
jgi:hypothetical protein